MGVRHAFTNPKADGGDATVTRPADWNANHVIDAGTITRAMIANVTTTKRVIGRNTAGAGVEEEVTASQIFDWVAAVNGSILTRTGGAWGAVANWATDGGDLVVTETFAPVAPTAGVKLHGALVGGRAMLSTIGPTGDRMISQPMTAQHLTWSISPRNDGAAVLTAANTRLDTAGPLTARAIAATNFYSSVHRAAYVSAAGAGSVANAHAAATWCLRGNVAKQGGFFMVVRFGVSDAALVGTANMFVGLSATGGLLADAGPETLLNLIGVGCTSGDTTLQLYCADGTARPRVSLGASFPCNTINADLYELALFAPPNAASVTYEVVRLNTGDRVTGTLSTNLPAATQLLTWQVQRSNGGAAAAVAIDIASVYGETDY